MKPAALPECLPVPAALASLGQLRISPKDTIGHSVYVNTKLAAISLTSQTETHVCHR